jgi:hypothetical protein
LAQGLAGEIVGTNALAEAGTGYDLGENKMLDGWERAEKGATGVAQVAGTLASGLTATKSLLRNCFLAGTLVAKYSTDETNQSELIPIENIRFGDKVWSFNFATNNWEPKPVLETFRTEYSGDIISINIGEDTIHATGGHPFWITSGDNLENRPFCDCLPDVERRMTTRGRWVYARDLRIGDVMSNRSLGTQKISELKLSTTETLVTVYFPILFFFWRFRYSRLFFVCKVLFSALCFGVTLYFFQFFFVFEYFFNWNYCFPAILSESGLRRLIGTTPQHILRSTPVKIPSIAVSKFPILK